MVPVKADGMSSGGASMIKKSDLLIAALAAAAIFTSVFSAGASELSVNGEDEKSGNTADTVLTLSYHDIPASGSTPALVLSSFFLPTGMSATFPKMRNIRIPVLSIWRNLLRRFWTIITGR